MEVPRHIPTVDDMRVLDRRGPWTTKSGGSLNVLCAFPFNEATELFLQYDPEELAKVPEDITGLRFYLITGLPSGKIGGTEWHRIRQEIIFILNGCLLWSCEDLHGNKKEFRMDGSFGLWMPPFIRHTYSVEADKTDILVFANTLFNPEDPRTHDTFPEDQFYELQKIVK